MDNFSLLEASYQMYIRNLNRWVPEGIVSVDLELLHQMGLLHYYEHTVGHDDTLTRYFHVIESSEKITLFNEEFVVWVAPEGGDAIPTTYVLIAFNTPEKPKLEMVFSASGVYNSSRLVLRVLEKYLQDIQETEETIKKFKKAA